MHQYNRRTAGLSRSWNTAYVQAGAERSQLALLARGWMRIKESWSFPLARRVRGYAQVFSGHGERLIDYNWKQTTVGVGISLADWF